MAESRHLLVVFHLAACTPERLRDVVPRIQAALTKLSEEPIEQAFRSSNADLFGYAIKSKLAAKAIQAALESPGGKYRSDAYPPLDGADNLLVLEIGADYSAGKGFTRLGTWLQRH